MKLNQKTQAFFQWWTNEYFYIESRPCLKDPTREFGVSALVTLVEPPPAAVGAPLVRRG